MIWNVQGQNITHLNCKTEQLTRTFAVLVQMISSPNLVIETPPSSFGS